MGEDIIRFLYLIKFSNRVSIVNDVNISPDRYIKPSYKWTISDYRRINLLNAKCDYIISDLFPEIEEENLNLWHYKQNINIANQLGL